MRRASKYSRPWRVFVSSHIFSYTLSCHYVVLPDERLVVSDYGGGVRVDHALAIRQGMQSCHNRSFAWPPAIFHEPYGRSRGGISSPTQRIKLLLLLLLLGLCRAKIKS